MRWVHVTLIIISLLTRSIFIIIIVVDPAGVKAFAHVIGVIAFVAAFVDANPVSPESPARIY